jgi:predicted DNA-binding transcriptional regulator AlpA
MPSSVDRRGRETAERIPNMSEQTAYKGIDLDHNERLLVGANALAWCMDCDPTTLKRWAAKGLMPKPIKIGNSIRWDAQTIRAWIDGGCQPVDER